MAEWVDDLVESVPAEPALAIGHSLGGVLLLEALPRLRPVRAVYEDPGWGISGDREPLIAEFEGRKRLSAADISRLNPRWPAEVVSMRLEGFAQWDEATARAFIGSRREYMPSGPPGQASLVVLAERSQFVTPAAAERLRNSGWQVQELPGTGHMVHLDDQSAFQSAVFGWLAASQSG